VCSSDLPAGLYALAVECDRDEAVDESGPGARDPDAIAARTRADYAPLAARAKGPIAMVAMTRESTSEVATGAPMLPGCRAIRPVHFERWRVQLRAGALAQDVVIVLAEVGGRRFLSTPPLVRR